MSHINVAVQDAALSIAQALPAAGANVTTPILDLQAVAPNSNAWRLGRIQVSVPALPENTGAGITVALQAAPPSLVAGAASIAPLFCCSWRVCYSGVRPNDYVRRSLLAHGLAQVAYFTLAFDSTGSTYQFYQFVITTPAGTVTVGEIVNIGWING